MKCLSALSGLVGQDSIERFVSDFLDRECFHRSWGVNYFRDSLSLDELSRFLCRRNLHAGEVSLICDGAILDASTVEMTDSYAPGQRAIDLDRMITMAFQKQCSLVINNGGIYFDGLSRLTEHLSKELHSIAHANVYITPKGARGFKVHWDTHDVFAIQLHGTKRWYLYEPRTVLPFPDEPSPILDEASLTPYAMPNVEMREGDVLYVPRGVIHRAEALAEASIHITIGLQRPLLSDWLRRESMDRQRHELARMAIDPRLFEDDGEVWGAMKAIIDKMGSCNEESLVASLNSCLAELRERRVKRVSSEWLNLFLELGSLRDGQAIRVLYRKEDLIEAEGELRITFGYRRLRLPTRFCQVAYHAAGAERLTVKDLENWISPAESERFVANLLADGFAVPID